MGNAVQNVAGEIYPGDMVTKFVCLVETIDGETGRRTMILSCMPGLAPWDVLGMLEWAKARETATIHSDYDAEE